MKSRGIHRRKPDYGMLEWKVFLKIVLLAAAAFIVVLSLRELVRGNMGNFIVDTLQNVFNMSYNDAYRFYIDTIGSNMAYIILAAVVVVFIIMFRFLMSQFARYFNEISGGLDVLVEDREGEIRLSEEMASMEQKLNAIKRTLKKREQDAKQAEQRKNDLVTYLAHDISTPLTSVIGYLNLMDEVKDMPAAQREGYIHITLEKAGRLEKLIGEFFEVTRFNLQTIVLTKEKIDLYYMLAQMADEFYPLLSAKGARIQLDAAESLTVCGDPDKLARVFNNILKNAVEYGPKDDILKITAGQAGGDIFIRFENSGGIPEHELSSIFDKFYRLDVSRSTGTGGAGLGLAIAKEIVTAHNGGIRADSDGKSTMFTVTLPVMGP